MDNVRGDSACSCIAPLSKCRRHPASLPLVHQHPNHQSRRITGASIGLHWPFWDPGSMRSFPVPGSVPLSGRCHAQCGQWETRAAKNKFLVATMPIHHGCTLYADISQSCNLSRLFLFFLSFLSGLSLSFAAHLYTEDQRWLFTR